MSSVSRTTSRGGKGAKQEATKTLKNDTKVDSPKSVDHNPKVQPTAEQMRIAQIIDTRSDEPGFKDKIRQVMDATRKTEDEVCTALHDCDNDLDKAVNMLLEGKAQGEWETSVKKKKSRQPVSAPAKPDVAANSGEQEDWDTEQPGVGVERERSRTRGGGPPRLRGRGSLDNRGWRGRENKENERNLDEGRGDGSFRRGAGRTTSGPGRSGRGGRGGGRLGPRTYQSREKQEDSSFPKSIDTWNNPGAEESTGGEPLKMEQWGDDFPSPEDWDNEEYTGSLADTKVFTPSGGVAETTINSSEEADTSVRSLSTSVASSSGAAQQDLQPQQTQMQSPSSGVGTLNAAQSEYLSQLTQQGSDVGLKSGANASSGTYKSSGGAYSGTPAAVAYSTSVAYSTASYPTNNTYMDADVTAHMPPRTKQRPRVPPPSKIPSSAVEMPGDAINSGGIGYLDVQFGGLEFGSEPSSFEPPPGLDQQPKYAGTGGPASALESMTSVRPPSNMDLPAPAVSQMDNYSNQQQKANNQNSIASQINQVQNLSSSNPDSILPEHKSRDSSSYRGGQSLDLDKPDVGLSYSTSSAPYQPYQKSATSYQPTQYSTASYASNAVTSSASTAYPANSSQMSSFSSSGSNYNSAPVAPSAYNQSSAYNASNAYQPTSSYPSISQAPAQNTPVSYQGGSQSVYSNLGYSTASSQQYQNNSYSGANSSSQQQNHAKMSSTLANTTKEAHYDVATTTTTNLSGASNGGSASSTAAASATKTTSSSTKSGGTVASLPPGVPPMMGATTHTQYIMGQAGMPYFQQPAPMYSYEDVQMMQQRLPHMPTGYYDMTFQAPTSLATGREGLASVAYSMSDGRFPRADNNASPVPATLSQQQQSGSQAHSQPMLNASGLPPGYTYYIQGGMVPSGFQYSTPAIYPMAASNAHSSGSSTQYPKPGSYSSGYGSGYDSLTANQDYGKSGYAGNSQSQQSKSGGGGSNSGSTASSASDLTATMMYGKTHVALGKVNSYEKQGFHSGTPPPFNLAGSQTTPLPPSGGYAPQLFIPTLPPQHHSMHQPPHQMEMRNTTRRSETGGSSNQRQSSTQANKSGQAKQGYNPSYWTPN